MQISEPRLGTYRGLTSLRCHCFAPKLEHAAMNQADADRLDKLAKAYSTNASYCRHMAAGARNRSSKEHWVRLAGVWTTLAAEVTERSRCSSVTRAAPHARLL